MDEKKYIEYKYSDKMVEVNDVLPMDGIKVNPFQDEIKNALKIAMKESIKANSIILNEKFAKVNPYFFNWFGLTAQIPPMICGLECSLISDELPDEYAFAILEKPQTERQHLTEIVKNETAQEVLEEYICEIVNARLCSTNDDLYYELVELKDDLLKRNYG